MRAIRRLLVVLLPVALAAAGWLAGPTLARAHRTVVLAELVLGPDAESPEAAESFEVQAFRMQGGDEEQLRAAALRVQRKFRIGGAIVGLWCGLVAALKTASLARVPLRTDFQIERGLCVACGRCFAACPKEHLVWKKSETLWARVKLDLGEWATNLRSRPSAPLVRSMLLSLGILAAAFSAIVLVTMLRNYASAYDLPWRNPASMADLQKQLADSPDSEPVMEAIRRQDAVLRRGFIARSRQMEAGRWMLLAGAVLMVLCLHGYVWLGHGLAGPPLDAGAEEPDWEVVARRNARATGLTAAALGAAMVGLVVLVPTIDLSGKAAKTPGDEQTVTVAWPRFRGPTGCGLAPEGDWPTEWDAASGKGVVWAVPISDPDKGIPADGNNSPVVWGDHIYLTSANADANWLHCYNRADGKVLWRTRVKSPPNSPMAGKSVEVFPDTGLAAPTAAVDTKGVYVTFANADVACIGHDGKQKWQLNLGVPDSPYGLASSLLTYRNTVIMQFDQGGDPAEEKSSILALDTTTGRVIWETVRPVRSSWSTPIIVRAGDHDELVTAAEPLVIAYDPASGTELWRASSIVGDVGPSPVFAAGMVFVANEYSQAVAIRVGGSGDVTETHVVWKDQTELPSMVSPLADAERYLHVHSYGVAVCYHAADGTILWQHDFQTAMTPSPSLAGRTVYLPALDGKTFLFEFADTFELKGTCDVGEETRASPAFVDGRILIRGKEKLFCIGK
ncbi:MAG: PQQ-binding-like beta-propeller repeat protein [Planctomycetes bacterium]|nr:PQQ-binding-like beta-propeller repeat protein [Planctomycetota bacterium]